MRLENIAWDARDPVRLGSFWAAALGASPITEEPDIFEARLVLADGFFLDLCFPRVAEPSVSTPRLHLDLFGAHEQAARVDRLLSLGAEHVDIGQGNVPWVVLADPEGNAFCVREDRAAYRDTGPIAALPLDSADPDRDLAFWQEITGWVPYDGVVPASLRHPSGRGPVLELSPERGAKAGKNRMHLDVRRDAAETEEAEIVERVTSLGATPLPTPEEFPWRVFTDPSGNEFCVLDPSQSQ